MRINTTNFSNDLQEGESMEYKVLDKIKKKYPKAYKLYGNHKAFDIYVPETDKRIEVKYDKLSEETGNFYIETEFNGEPSGITTTLSDLWVIVDNTSIIWIKPESLRYLIKDMSPKVSVGEDGTVVKGVLLKKTVLLSAIDYVKVYPLKK